MATPRPPFPFALPLLLLGATLFLACKKDDDPDPPTPCDKLWSVTNPSGFSATIQDGYLLLSKADSVPGGQAITLLQDSLVGDFSLSATFSDFEDGASGNGAYCQLVMSNGGPPNYDMAVAGIGTLTPAGTGLQASVQVNDGTGATVASDYVTTASTAGSFQIARSGSLLTLTTSTAGGVASQSSVAFNGRGLAVGLQMGSNGGVVQGPVRIRIQDFQLTGGGTQVKSDAFDCNSLH